MEGREWCCTSAKTASCPMEGAKHLSKLKRWDSRIDEPSWPTWDSRQADTAVDVGRCCMAGSVRVWCRAGVTDI